MLICLWCTNCNKKRIRTSNNRFSNRVTRHFFLLFFQVFASFTSTTTTTATTTTSSISTTSFFNIITAFSVPGSFLLECCLIFFSYSHIQQKRTPTQSVVSNLHIVNNIVYTLYYHLTDQKHRQSTKN